MSLFQQSVIDKKLNSLDNNAILPKWELFKLHFHNPAVQENIRKSKEEQYQEGFLRDLFVNILGYTLNPKEGFNLTTEYKNIKDSKKADGAIIIENKVKAVIELKGNDTTDLDKIEPQAFGYKNNQPDCKYIIISNFEKLRFYIENTIDYIEFNLFNLTYDEFKLLWICLRVENITADLPQKIKNASVNHEEIITKELYKDYSTFKRELFKNLVELNPGYDELELFKKSQKLLDRFLFILFAEDRDLLPLNSTRLILSQWKELVELDADIPLYNRYKKYFNYLNTGHMGKNSEIFAYNGGLFKPDEILDNLLINDELLYKHTLKLSSYDYGSDVDVNILGHIFENSLNEIDEIKSQIEGKEIDKSQSKRKKDGIFYTPKYITKYIVENTVGRLCEEKKHELQIEDAEFTGPKAKQKEDKQALIKRISTYREWLLQITIVDPACGSGAFLNEALNFLIDEHRYLDELETKITGGAIVFPNIENSILENNLFGVDINEESVEIAKLSLWLRTAKPRRKLNDLSNNIKCGNSLIDDPEVAGNKAFNWQNEFPHVFAKGGFDVVIGNPPYVVLSSFSDNSFNYLQDKYKTSYGRLNTFALFIEKATQLIHENSSIGLIVPDSLCLIDYYSNLRKYLLDNYSIEKLIDLGEGIFADATVPALIIILGKKKLDNKIEIRKRNNYQSFEIQSSIEQDYYYLTPKFSFNLLADSLFIKIQNKINYNDIFPLKDLLQIKIGVCTGNNNKFLSKKPEFENSKKVLQGKDINKYTLTYNNLYLNYDKKALLRARDEQIFLKEEKLLMRQTSDKLILTYDNNQFYTIDSLFIIYPLNVTLNLKYVLTLLNSKLLNRQYQKINPEAGRVFAQVKIDYVNELPIHLLNSSQQQPFIEKADQMLSLNKDLQDAKGKLQRNLQREFGLETLTTKLQNWDEGTYDEFLKELAKAKVKLSLSQKAEWEDYFIAEQKKIQEIKHQIESTDREIDRMVYELYELTEDEIKIVEGA